jgi:hypothetical protein
VKFSPLCSTDLEKFNLAALAYNSASASTALRIMSTSRPILLGFAGWPCAGKDILPEHLYKNLGLQPVHLGLSFPLKNEVNHIINICRTSTNYSNCQTTIELEMGVSPVIANKVVKDMYNLSKSSPITATTRTPEMRKVLQWWGGQVRRDQDASYWAKAALSPAVDAIAAGKSCYISDIRFPNDVTAAQDLGFLVIRLEVSPETVRRRLEYRDKLVVSDAALENLLENPAESALSGFSGFDFTVDNNGPLELTLDSILRFLRTR